MTDTLAFRKLFGILVPYFNSVVQPEMESLRPTGVSNQTARFTLDENVLEDVAKSAENLATCGIHGLVIALSTESFPGGLALLEQGADEVRRRTQLPVTTASHAVADAIRAFGATRVAIVTPFDRSANTHVRDAFEQRGFDVIAVDGLSCPDMTKIGHCRPDEIRRCFEAVDGDRVEILVQVGTGLPVLGLVEELEKTHGKPVVAANAAAYWRILRDTGVEDRLPARGRLFAEH